MSLHRVQLLVNNDNRPDGPEVGRFSNVVAVCVKIKVTGTKKQRSLTRFPAFLSAQSGPDRLDDEICVVDGGVNEIGMLFLRYRPFADLHV